MSVNKPKPRKSIDVKPFNSEYLVKLETKLFSNFWAYSRPDLIHSHQAFGIENVKIFIYANSYFSKTANIPLDRMSRSSRSIYRPISSDFDFRLYFQI